MEEQKSCVVGACGTKIEQNTNLKSLQEQNLKIQEVKWTYQDNNILSSGMDRLLDLRSHLDDLKIYKENVKQLEAEDDDLEHLIIMKERAITDETEAVVKKRRGEVLATFENQLDNTKSEIKKVKSKREKRKNKKISERIAEETAGVRHEMQQNKEEARQAFKMNGVPKILNKQIIHALFFPSCITDVLTDIIIVIMAFLVVPNIFVRFIFNTNRILYITLIYFAAIFLFGAIYLTVNANIKSRYSEIFIKVKAIRSKIKNNKREIKRIKKTVIRDKDESNYGLEKYNKELTDLEKTMELIADRKKQAIDEFENTTRLIIAKEVLDNNKQELENLQQKHDEVHELNKSYTNKVKELEMQLASTYEAYLGKTFMNLEKLDKLIKIMEGQDGMVVSDAIKLYQDQLINK